MKIVKIATHDGVFHADEVFALTVLKLYFEKENKQIEIIRTRDLKKVSLCDMAVDVGGEYDNKKSKFDHHQKEKPGYHVEGVPYASFGLIWKHFGRKITANKKVHEAIERKLVVPIDALDNGVSVSVPVFKGIYEFGTAQIISAISKAYPEGEMNTAFEKVMELAKLIIIGEIAKTEAKILGEKIITEEIQKQGIPEVLVLDKYVSWEVAVSKFKNIKLVIFPDKEPDRWCIQAARDNLDVYGGDRASFPREWRGLSNENLAAMTGVSDSVFCHTGGFFAVTRSKIAAIDMANKVITIKKA